jgi:hypothetical protein
MKINKLLALPVWMLLVFLLASCDQNASKKTIGNSQDTTSVTKGGGPPIRDTATINKERRDSAKLPAKSNTAKGNADPSGRIKNQ